VWPRASIARDQISWTPGLLQFSHERWRWLPHDLATPLIAVNVPAFRLYGFDEPHHIALKMNVVVGKAMRSETPAFIGNMTYLVFRPDWGVPPTILRKEILPPLQKDSAYLSKNGYDLIDASGKVLNAEQVTPEEIQLLRAGKLSVRQRPGPKNALGKAGASACQGISLLSQSSA
jgi:L,D-transpeptidase YcbB